MELIFGAGGGKPGAAAGADLVKEGSSAGFVADVIDASRDAVVVVEFYSPRFASPGPFSATLEKAVRDQKGAARLVRINVDKNYELAAQLRVETVPMVYAFQGGRPLDAFAGALPEAQIKSFVQRLTAGQGELPSAADFINQAKEILAEGDPTTAAQIFQQVLAEEPDNAAATAGLMRCLLALGDHARAKRMLDQLSAEMLKNAEVAAVKTALDLQESAAAIGPAAELRRRVATDPDDFQARFDLATAYFAGGEPEAAIDELLELFRRNRAWNDEAARKQLIKLFEALGPTHPQTLAGRRRLSALMFS